jgi:hypothetical protein
LFCKSVSKLTAGLSCMLMAACVTFQLIYTAAVDLVLLVAVDCKVLHCNAVKYVHYSQPRFLSIFFFGTVCGS